MSERADPAVVSLADGRQLSYVDQGERDGRPLLYFHGAPGLSRLRPDDERVATQRGVRVLSVHRPGYQGSDPKPGRTLADWSDDVGELADRLGLGRFAIVGFSSGGAHALACASKIADRIDAVGAVASFAPFDRPSATAGMSREMRLVYGAGRRAPVLVRPMIAAWSRLVTRNPDAFFGKLNAGACPSHAAMAEEPHFRSIMVADFAADAARHGRGMVGEVLAHTRSWGFRLEDVHIPVHLWHGELDPIVPVSHGRYLAEHLPICVAAFYPEEGHEVLFSHFGEVLDTLVPAR